MDREKTRKKKRGRKGRQTSAREGFTKEVKDGALPLGCWGHCFWLAPSYWMPMDTRHANCPGHMSGSL